MTEVLFLGVGSAMPAAPADDHTALLVFHESLAILLDSGPGIMRQLENAEVTVGDLTHVFVSHQHGDHALGFPMLLLNRVLLWPERPLRVLGTRQVLDALQSLTALMYPDVGKRAEQAIEYVALSEEPGQHLLPGAPNIRYTLAAGRHSIDTWGLRLTLPSGRSLMYSADTGYSRPMAALAADVDVLIHEAFYLDEPEETNPNHSCARQVGQLAQQAAAKTLVLVHRMDTTLSSAEQYRQEAAKYFGGSIVVPSAGDRLSC